MTILAMAVLNLVAGEDGAIVGGLEFFFANLGNRFWLLNQQHQQRNYTKGFQILASSLLWLPFLAEVLSYSGDVNFWVCSPEDLSMLSGSSITQFNQPRFLVKVLSYFGDINCRLCSPEVLSML